MTHVPKKAPKAKTAKAPKATKAPKSKAAKTPKVASYGSHSAGKKGITHRVSRYDPAGAMAISATPRQPVPVATRRETELLDRINIGLSESQARRFQELDSLREQERLTSAELAEFRALADASERMRNDRFEALAELAGLRGESVPSLMVQMGLGLSGG